MEEQLLERKLPVNGKRINMERTRRETQQSKRNSGVFGCES